MGTRTYAWVCVTQSLPYRNLESLDVTYRVMVHSRAGPVAHVFDSLATVHYADELLTPCHCVW